MAGVSWEGNEEFTGGEAPNYAPPFFVYGHSHGCSVTGGYVYRGTAIDDLRGVYLLGDFCSGRIWAAWRDHGMHWQVIELINKDIQISSFGEDEAGELYVVDFASGALFRIDPVGIPTEFATRDRAPAAADVQLTPIIHGLTRPLYVTHAGDRSGRLFLVEQTGRILILKEGSISAQPFLDVSELVTPPPMTDQFTEQGLLGLAFHPDYYANGIFFISYTDRKGNTSVARYQVSGDNPDIADADSAQLIFQLSQPYPNNNGGHIAFGSDGYLYIALGDGGADNDPLGAGQDLRLLQGSILRIDVDGGLPYAIPADNPFVGFADALDEIWSYGLRNPWRFSFDRATGEMYVGDIGQNEWQEVTLAPAINFGGANYGWSVFEGHQPIAGNGVTAPNHQNPFFVYGHEHGCAVTGGYVYRGEAVPGLKAVYLLGDFCSGRIWASWRSLDWKRKVIELTQTDMQIISFGEDEAGEVYVIDYGGALYRIEPLVLE